MRAREGEASNYSTIKAQESKNLFDEWERKKETQVFCTIFKRNRMMKSPEIEQRMGHVINFIGRVCKLVYIYYCVYECQCLNV